MSTRCLMFTLVASALLAGCGHSGRRHTGYDGQFTAQVAGGAAERGGRLLVQHGCGACHTVPGPYRARGRVGPPLDFFAERSFIGGQLPNRPETLVRWIMDAPSLIPATAMPNLNVSERDARDIAAYLYTLH